MLPFEFEVVYIAEIDKFKQAHLAANIVMDDTATCIYDDVTYLGDAMAGQRSELATVCRNSAATADGDEKPKKKSKFKSKSAELGKPWCVRHESDDCWQEYYAQKSDIMQTRREHGCLGGLAAGTSCTSWSKANTKCQENQTAMSRLDVTEASVATFMATLYTIEFEEVDWFYLENVDAIGNLA
jgi:site-specific DNA-cytosine methylase